MLKLQKVLESSGTPAASMKKFPGRREEPSGERGSLFKVFRAGFEEGLVLIARDVKAHILAPPLQVAHLSKDAAVRGENTLDGHGGAIGVDVDAHVIAGRG